MYEKVIKVEILSPEVHHNGVEINETSFVSKHSLCTEIITTHTFSPKNHWYLVYVAY